MSRHFTRTALRLGVILHAACVLGWALPQSGEIALRQIVLGSEQEAMEVRASLSKGASFEDLATERSRDDATALRGGYVGRVRRSDLRSEVQQALLPIKPGGFTDPVRMGDVHVLFQVVPEAEARWIDLDDAGAQALAEGRTKEAAALFEQALAQAESGGLSGVVPRALDSLAAAYRFEGRAGEAEKLYRRALALLEHTNSRELEIAQILTGLGMSLAAQGRFADAASLYERARTIREKRLGPDSPEVAATLHSLAEAMAGLKRFVEAAKLYEQSQALLSKSMGADHPATAAGAQSLLAFRRSLMPELLERLSTLVSLSEFRDRDFDRTVAEIGELLPLAPLSEHSYVQMKDILLEVGLSGETELVLRKGLDKFPKSRILRIYLADLMAGTGRTQSALGVLEEAGRLSKPEGLDDGTDRQQRSIIYQRIGDIQSALTHFDDALAAYRQAVELYPTSQEGRVKVGKAYFASNRLEEARAEFERAIREMPDNDEAHLNLSEAYLAGGDWQRAAAAASRAIELGASDSRALYLLGTALLRMGQRDEGQKHLQEFAQVESGFRDEEHRKREIDAISVAAIGSWRQGNSDTAIQKLTQGIAAYPDAGRLHMNLGMIHSRLGQHEAAVKTLESMLESGIGRRFLVHKNLADEYEILGNTEASRRHQQIYRETREAELIVYAPE
jgi:tetratricopeptide (TPR) repeat protein